MIVAKPKPSMLFPLTVFLALAYGLVIFTLVNFLSTEDKAAYQYAILIVISPIAVGVTIKVLLDYKIVKAGKGKIVVRYPFRFRSMAYKVSQVEKWGETTAKAGRRIFKELSITFDDKAKVKLTKQEYASYEQVHNYLKNKCPKKKLR